MHLSMVLVKRGNVPVSRVAVKGDTNSVSIITMWSCIEELTTNASTIVAMWHIISVSITRTWLGEGVVDILLEGDPLSTFSSTLSSISNVPFVFSKPEGGLLLLSVSPCVFLQCSCHIGYMESKDIFSSNDKNFRPPLL